MKNNKKIYYWIEFVLLVIGVIYTINLYLFKTSIKTNFSKCHHGILKSIYATLQIPSYANYLYVGMILLELIVGYSIYYLLQNKEEIFKGGVNVLIVFVNIILVVVIACIFNDSIFTTVLVIFGISETVLALAYDEQEG